MYNLNDADQKIKELLDKDPSKIYTIKQIASLLGYKASYIRNRLLKNEPLLKNNLIIKEKTGGFSFFKGIKKLFPSLIKYIDSEVKSEQLKDLLLNIIANKYPLGVHYLNLYKKDLGIAERYDSMDWKILKGNQQKKYRIKGIEEYGKTQIFISKGKTKGKTPSIQINYSGKEEKKFLTKESFKTWYKIVESVLKNLLNLNYGLDSFYILQIEFNYDIELNPQKFKEIYTMRNTKMRTLKDIYEHYIYEIEEEDGKKVYLRNGRRIEEMTDVKINKDFMEDKGIISFFDYQQKLVDGVNYAMEQSKDVEKIKKQLTSLINQNSKSNQIMTQIIDEYPTSINNLTKRIKNYTEFFTSDLEIIKGDIEKYKEAISTEIRDRKENENKFLDIFNKINEVMNENSQREKDILKIAENISTSSDSNYQQTIDIIKTINKRMKKSEDLQEKLMDFFISSSSRKLRKAFIKKFSKNH